MHNQAVGQRSAHQHWQVPPPPPAPHAVAVVVQTRDPHAPQQVHHVQMTPVYLTPEQQYMMQQRAAAAAQVQAAAQPVFVMQPSPQPQPAQTGVPARSVGNYAAPTRDAPTHDRGALVPRNYFGPR